MKKFISSSIVLAFAVLFTFGPTGLNSASAATAVNLDSADDFAVLAGSTVTNTGSSVITGDLGLSPGTSVTGFPPGTLSGTEHIANTTAELAKTDLKTAYNDAAGQTPVTTIPTELGGTTLTGGIYDSSAGTFGITGTLTLDAEGDADTVFIFHTESTMITASSSVVRLINGAQACNVFWQVGSSATIGANSILKGNILALTSITLNTGANVEGRVLARNGAVTLDTNVVTRATCVAPPEVPETPDEVAVPPLINVVKVPDPLALPDGEGSVTYNYSVTNVGTVAMSNILVTDNKCDTVEFNSGDTNNDDNLDLNETWKYSCTRTVAKTLTNTVTATGEANGFTATDTANATVVVGVDAPPPLINLVKVSDEPIVTVGDAVTYTYTVTNPGTVALTDVSVTDDLCSPVTYSSGDDNNNDTLNVSETWVYTCETNLIATTTNTGTAQGSANGLTAIDYSLVTVVVEEDTTEDTETEEDTTTTTEDDTTEDSATATTETTVPSLPKTGVEPNQQNNAWKVSIGILAAALALFYVARKKQTV